METRQDAEEALRGLLGWEQDLRRFPTPKSLISIARVLRDVLLRRAVDFRLITFLFPRVPPTTNRPHPRRACAFTVNLARELRRDRWTFCAHGAIYAPNIS